MSEPSSDCLNTDTFLRTEHISLFRLRAHYKDYEGEDAHFFRIALSIEHAPVVLGHLQVEVTGNEVIATSMVLLDEQGTASLASLNDDELRALVRESSIATVAYHAAAQGVRSLAALIDARIETEPRTPDFEIDILRPDPDGDQSEDEMETDAKN